MWLSGALSRMNAAVPVDLVTIKLGPAVPKIWRVGVLIDNLDNPGYTPAQLALVVDGRESDPVMTTGGAGSANSAPDWYFWDVAGAKDNSEVTLRVSPGNGVAAIGGLVFFAGEEPRQIGEFSRDGEYVKDYYVFKEGDTFHLFYNVGAAGEKQDWQQPGNEKAFGHATSKDLKTWEHHPRILQAVPGTWEGEVVSAPCVLKHNGTYYLFYTGFDDRVLGKQSIGFASSKDLFNWERHPGNPVYEAPPWTARNQSGWLDCRDAHVIKSGDEFLMFTMVTTAEGKGAIAVASSSDLIAWKDLGPAVVTFTTPESPRVFEHDGSYYMIASSAHGKELFKTANPKTGPWESLSFRWPSPGLWSGWEMVEDGGRTIFSAFEWQPFGNHIRFWNVRWKDGTPIVVY
jgi:beta-fructofuranosidase